MYCCLHIPSTMSKVMEESVEKLLNTKKEDIFSKRKHRRGRRRRKAKSYADLSHQERDALEKKEKEKAAKIEARQARLGRPTAPFNSNTFLIEDREDSKTVEQCLLRFFKRSQSTNSPSADEEAEEETYESLEDSLSEEEERLERDFQAQYDQACRERFSDLNREDLVDECVKLEATLQRVEDDSRQKIASLESELTSLRSLHRTTPCTTTTSGSSNSDAALLVTGVSPTTAGTTGIGTGIIGVGTTGFTGAGVGTTGIGACGTGAATVALGTAQDWDGLRDSEDQQFNSPLPALSQ